MEQTLCASLPSVNNEVTTITSFQFLLLFSSFVVFIECFSSKMGRNRRGRRRTGRSGGQGANGGYTEVFTFSVEAGHTAEVLVSTLGNRPPRSNFRIAWMEVEFTSFVAGTGSLPATFTPVAFQCSLGEGTQQGSTGLYQEATSPLRLASTAPRRVHVRAPVSMAWFSFDTAERTAIGNLTAVCIGRPADASSTSYIRGVARIRVQLQTETSASTCPTYLESHGGSSSSRSSDFEDLVCSPTARVG